MVQPKNVRGCLDAGNRQDRRKGKKRKHGQSFQSLFRQELYLNFNMATMFVTEINTTEGALFGFLTGLGFVKMGIGVNSMY